MYCGLKNSWNRLVTYLIFYWKLLNYDLSKKKFIGYYLYVKSEYFLWILHSEKNTILISLITTICSPLLYIVSINNIHFYCINNFFFFFSWLLTFYSNIIWGFLNEKPKGCHWTTFNYELCYDKVRDRWGIQ